MVAWTIFVCIYIYIAKGVYNIQAQFFSRPPITPLSIFTVHVTLQCIFVIFMCLSYFIKICFVSIF